MIERNNILKTKRKHKKKNKIEEKTIKKCKQQHVQEVLSFSLYLSL